MTKPLAWLTTVVSSGFFLFCAFGLVAALDEFARIPFYDTLPLAALLVNGAALLLFWRKSEIAPRFYSKLKFGTNAFYEPATPDDAGSNWGKSPRALVSHSGATFNRNESEKISAAVGKIHSVAWWLPASAGSVHADIQETIINHEAR